MKVDTTPIDGLCIITPDVFGDARGFFVEQFHAQHYKEIIGSSLEFVQDNCSRSDRGVLRGLHYQEAPYTQGKLVSVLQGSVYDVAVDIRKDSQTFGQHFALTLQAPQRRSDGSWHWQQFWIPPGFAHGFLALENETIFSYKCSAYYAPEHDKGILWSDTDIGIVWPKIAGEYRISQKDAQHPGIGDIAPLA